MRTIDQELLDAAQQGNFSKVQECLEKGADVNIAGHGGGSKPIHYAVHANNQRMIRLLLDKGANVNDANNFGWTPLHCAADDGNLEVVKLLVNEGADIHATKPAARYGYGSHFLNFTMRSVANLFGLGVTPLDVAKKGRT
ncbi:MAG: ankyrin repeat domain-containing protein [Wolbachia endosymbiont of Menacanthus eurysternus]|nr:ankyrin repeat domain-containing protein [Wolbachia endosymbiont of Menacanthus eurysternus]